MTSRPRRSGIASGLALGLLGFLLLAYGCGGGGGGGGDGGGDGGGGNTDSGGSSGTGAGGIAVFGWKYAAADFGGAASVVETPGGTFVFAGVRQPDQQPAQLYLAKVDATGGLLWEKSSLGLDGGVALANSIRSTSDGGFLLAGYTSNSSADNFYLLKADSDGNQVWSKPYPGSLGQSGFASALQTADGGYVALGSKDNGGEGKWIDVFLVKAKADGPSGSPGTVEWERTFGGNGPDYGYALAPTADDGFVVAGEWDHGSSPSLYLVKADSQGNESWSRHSYGPGRAYGVVEAADGGFVLVGAVPDAGGKDDLLVLRTDAGGAEIRRRVFGGARDDLARSVARTPDGGYIVGGSTRSFSSGTDPDHSPWQTEDFYVLKLGQDLNTEWQTVKGRAPDSGDAGMAVQPTSDGGYVLAGSLGGSIALAKFDRSGDTVLLGDTDFTAHPTQGAGIITMANAEDAAGASATAFDIARLIGPFTLDRLTGVLRGDPVSGLCTGGGTYTHDLTPGPSVAAGTVFSLTFSGCVANLGGPVTFGGTVRATVSTLTGDPLTPTYEIDSTIHLDGFVFTDDVGTKTVGGDLRFLRTATTVGNTDRAEAQADKSLTLDAGSWTLEIAPFSVSTAQTATLSTLGPATATVRRSGIGSLQTSIEPPDLVTGPSAAAPTAGVIQTTAAADQTSVKATVGSGGNIQLAVDTDGNGTVDGTQNTAWDQLLY